MIKQKALYVVLGLLGAVLWAYGVDAVYFFVGQEGAKYDLIMDCVVSPVWETAAYIYAPLTIAKKLGDDYVVPVAVFSSFMFGWGHGEVVDGVLLQGVLGLIFSWVFLNAGFGASLVVHILYNVTFTIL